MQDLILIVGFVLVLVSLTIASLWIGPDNRQSVDPWTITWPV
jgi:hypothetical protein